VSEWGEYTRRATWGTAPSFLEGLVPRETIEWGPRIYTYTSIFRMRPWWRSLSFDDVMRAINPNGRDGEWRYLQIGLAYDVADVLIGDGRVVTVPVFLPDPERAAWRRRKWWGRGPIKPLGMPWWCECSSVTCTSKAGCLPF
jgi:hypothetical protein